MANTEAPSHYPEEEDEIDAQDLASAVIGICRSGDKGLIRALRENIRESQRSIRRANEIAAVRAELAAMREEIKHMRATVASLTGRPPGRRLGDILISQEIITEEQLSGALSAQREEEENLEEPST